jgi:DNA-binding LacI/PurR family transcriptional regulator
VAIRELGYRPNATARSLTQRRTNAIGVLVNDLRQPWLLDFLSGLHLTLFEHELHPFLGDGRLDRATDEQLLRVFMEMRVDGLVLAATMPESTTITEAASWLPTVVAGGRDFDLPHVDTIAQDDWMIGELAIAHLVELGHRRIGHVAGDRTRVFDIRRASYEACMTRHGLGQFSAVVACDTTEEGGYLAGRKLLDSPPQERPTALFVANDLSCVGAMSAARDLGLDVPRDVSFVGVDNSVLARMRHVQLTSVDVLAEEVGRLSARHLVERIATPNLPAREHLVTPLLHVRGSTAPSP